MSNLKTNSIWNNNWLSGAAGVATILLCALWFQNTNALKAGVSVFGYSVTNTTFNSTLMPLLLTAAMIFLVECIRQAKSSGSLFEHHPEKDLNFYANCFVFYLQNVALLIAIKMFYQTAGEYGYAHKSAFYKPWFECLSLFIKIHLYLGLPYIILTRSLKYDPDADNARYGNLVAKLLFLLISLIPFLKSLKPNFGTIEKQAFLSLLIQLFFIPLIVVFFFQIFPQLVNGIGYLKSGFPNSFTASGFVHKTFNLDLARLVIGFLFSAHLVILFTSYAATSRWIQNTKQSVDTTLLSWMACLIVYPPFHHLMLTSWVKAILTPQLEGPSHLLTRIPSQTLVTICVFLMITFYIVHILSTISLGKFNANLSYRALVQTGMYSLVRHPSYTAKLLGLTCILLPLIGLNASDGNWEHAAALAGGLAAGYVIFIVRSLREERWLKLHCDYESYCQKVPYRFIPRLI